MRVAFSCLALAIAARSVAIADDEDNASPVKKVQLDFTGFTRDFRVFELWKVSYLHKLVWPAFFTDHCSTKFGRFSIQRLFVFSNRTTVRMKKKVLKLLKDMQGQLESEKAKEEEVYAKLSCWCEVNGKEKDAAVDAALRKTAE